MRPLNPPTPLPSPIFLSFFGRLSCRKKERKALSFAALGKVENFIAIELGTCYELNGKCLRDNRSGIDGAGCAKCQVCSALRITLLKVGTYFTFLSARHKMTELNQMFVFIFVGFLKLLFHYKPFIYFFLSKEIKRFYSH